MYETLTYAISWFKWIKGSGPQNILSNLTGKIKRNTRSDAGRGSKQDVVCVTVSASLGGLCVAPIWWQTVLRMTPWEFPGNYYYLLPLLPLVCKALYCWMVFKWVLLQLSGFQFAAIPASYCEHIFQTSAQKYRLSFIIGLRQKVMRMKKSWVVTIGISTLFRYPQCKQT